jgi:hypothetical protein
MKFIAWKCYRCDLTFKEKSAAIIHEDLSKHTIEKIGLVSE